MQMFNCLKYLAIRIQVLKQNIIKILVDAANLRQVLRMLI